MKINLEKMFPIGIKNFQPIVSPDLKYEIQYHNPDFSVREITEFEYTSEKERYFFDDDDGIISARSNEHNIIGLINDAQISYSNNCIFIRSEFILFDGYPKMIYNLKSGNFLCFIPTYVKFEKYLDEHELFLIRTGLKMVYPSGFSKFHINNFSIFKLWSFIACIYSKFLLLDGSLFTEIMDFCEPKQPSLYCDENYFIERVEWQFLKPIN